MRTLALALVCLALTASGPRRSLGKAAEKKVEPRWGDGVVIGTGIVGGAATAHDQAHPEGVPKLSARKLALRRRERWTYVILLAMTAIAVVWVSRAVLQVATCLRCRWHGVPAVGVVVDLERQGSPGVGTTIRPASMPTYIYQVAGRRYAVTAGSGTCHDVGDRIPIRYLPGQPEVSRPVDDPGLWLGAKLLFGAAAYLGLVAYVVIGMRRPPRQAPGPPKRKTKRHG